MSVQRAPQAVPAGTSTQSRTIPGSKSQSSKSQSSTSQSWKSRSLNIQGLIFAAVALPLAGFALSCGGSSSSSTKVTVHNAYVTMPKATSVGLLHIDSNGNISVVSQTTPVSGFSPASLAVHPSKKFLYVASSGGNSIFIYNVAADGSLSVVGNPTPAGAGPLSLVIDPAGKFLLVANYFDNSISVFSIDSGTGALSQVNGSPFPSNTGPTNLLITPSGKFVYVAIPNGGFVEGFSLGSDGSLTLVPNSPVAAGAGTGAMAVDPGEHFLYTANLSGDSISAFTIDPGTGALTPVVNLPYSTCVGPVGLGVESSSKFLYAACNSSSSNIYVYSIDAASGRLTLLNLTAISAAGANFLLMEPAGGFFYVGDQTGNSIHSFSYVSTTGVPKEITGSPFTVGTAPGDLIVP